MTPLHIGTTTAGEPFTLPLETLTTMTAIIGRRGSGKTTTALDVAEEYIDAGLPVVLLDPNGVHWGLRSGADGESPGLAVTILGGSHGDLPLEETAGKLIAELVVDQPGAYIIDFSGFESRAAEKRFAADFAERIYRLKRSSDRTALGLIVDEADTFAPQNAKGEERMLGAFEAIARRGRAFGLGMVVITQRPAVLNKNVLSQTELMIAHQVTAPQDRAALRDWAQGNATPDEVVRFIGSLAQLQVGEAWVWSPAWLQIFERIQVRPRRTFDSSATPKAGEMRVEPRVLAPVDLDVLRERMAATIEKAAADDPKALRQVIATLERSLKAATDAKNATVQSCEHEPIIVQLQADLEAERSENNRIHEAFLRNRGRLAERVRDLIYDLSFVPEEDDANIRASVVRHNSGSGETPPVDRGLHNSMAGAGRAPITDRGHIGQNRRRIGAVSTIAQPGSVRPGEGGTTLAKAERAILAALAPFFPDSRSAKQVALLTGYAIKGGGFNNALGSLRTKGFIWGGKDGMKPTPAGLDALGEYVPLPTGVALLEHWQGQLPKAERTILGVLYEAWPAALTKEELALRAGYEPTGGGFNNAMGKLRTLELIEHGTPRLSDDLAGVG